MEREIKILGKGVTDKDRKMVTKDLDTERKEKLWQPIEGEEQKGEYELRMLEKVNNHLQQEFEGLTEEKYTAVIPGQVHFFSPEMFLAFFPQARGKSHYQSLVEVININKGDYQNPADFYRTLLHEALHCKSHQKYYFYLGRNESEIRDYRSGFALRHPQEDSHYHFRLLSEAINYKLVKEIMQKHEQELIKEFNIFPEDFQQSVQECSKQKSVKLLNLLIRELAASKQAETSEVWGKLRKGLFTGEMMVLGDIEKIFGPGSLRLIAALGSEGATKEKLSEREAVQKIWRYCKTKDEKEKNKIAAEVLSERERIRYFNIRRSGQKRLKNDVDHAKNVKQD